MKKWLQNGIKNILSVKINITIKSRDKVKCETNMSQLRINKKKWYSRKQGKSVLFQHSKLLVVVKTRMTGPLVSRHLTANTQAHKLFYSQPLNMFTRFVRFSETKVSFQRINIPQL